MAGVVLAGVGAGRPAIAAAAAPILAPGASLAHPYSDPVWWPFSTEIVPDCYRGNPGCTDPVYHTTWLMDPVSTNRSVNGPTAHEPVYAMGAGIVHYGVHADQGCGGAHGRGNYLWIDHGNGTLSWYGHLYWPFSVADGEYVTARTQIGQIGNSGVSGCRVYPSLHYTDIAVETGARNGNPAGVYTELRHLYACVDGARQTWPDQLPGYEGRYASWNSVPKSNRYDGPVIIAAADASRSCIPATPPTPAAATGVRLSPSGAGALTASWSRPVGASSTVVLLEEYHPSIRRWLQTSRRTVGGATVAARFTGLYRGHSFRVTVSLRNGAGTSAGARSRTAVAR